MCKTIDFMREKLKKTKLPQIFLNIPLTKEEVYVLMNCIDDRREDIFEEERVLATERQKDIEDVQDYVPFTVALDSFENDIGDYIIMLDLGETTEKFNFRVYVYELLYLVALIELDREVAKDDGAIHRVHILDSLYNKVYPLYNQYYDPIIKFFIEKHTYKERALLMELAWGKDIEHL
jgi:hypothetical protein